MCAPVGPGSEAGTRHSRVNHHDTLLTLLDQSLPLADTALRGLLARVIAQPYVFHGQAHTRAHGLAQGAPLSPLLANPALTALDRAMELPGVCYVRYADDFVVLARSKQQVRAALAVATQALDQAHLRLAAHKTCIGHLQNGFTFLGESFNAASLEPRPASTPAQRKPMIVTEPYLQLGVNGDALEARRDGKHVSIVGGGREHFLAHQHAHAVWHYAQEPASLLALAREVVDAKLHNQAQLVVQRRGHAALAERIEELRRKASAASSLNSLLNFLYFLLYARVNGLVRMLGLNPYLGWLHEAQGQGYETLVYDLMEPLRPFVDRAALRLINRQELRPQHFEDVGGALRLQRNTARLVADRFEEAMGERLQGMALRELLWRQLQSVRRMADQQGSLWLFHWTPREPLAPSTEPQVLGLDTLLEGAQIAQN